IHQLIEECSIEVPEEQKQKMEDTMFDLLKIFHHKQFICIHDDVNNLIESALESKLLSINSQRLDKKEQEVKNVEEQPTERRNHAERSLQNFRIFSNSNNDDDISIDDNAFKDIEYVEALLSDPKIVNVEEDNVVQQEEEEVDFEDISQIQVNSFESDNSLLDNFSLEFKTFCDHSEETRSGNTTHANYSLPEYDSFCFEIKPDQEMSINLVENDIPDNSSNGPLLEEVDLFLSDDSIPPGIENFADDPEGDIRFLEELLIDDSILSHESFDSSFEDNPSILRPPLEPPDNNFDLEPEVISAVMEDIDEPDEHFNPGGEIFVSKSNEDVDYFPFMFVIQIFLPYLILYEISPLFLSTESEDTIFDHGIFE
nr:hypothetical protein [Tanacetum cinerariifolium]